MSDAKNTEADVERDDTRTRDALERHATFHGGDIIRVGALGSLDRLKAAALEGAKVPGLERQGLDMARQVGELSAEVATLTRERDEALAKVEAQASLVKTADRFTHEALAERDALRAQVVQARAIASGVAARMPEDVAGAVALDILSALSAPSAEATTCPGCGHAPHKAKCETCTCRPQE